MSYTDKSAAELRDMARNEWKAKEDSFDRCDTDGFLSQWATGLTAQMYEAQAKIADAGGVATFPGLFDRATGARVKAKLINGKYGWCWAFCDEHGEFTGRFLGDARTKRAKLWKEGFEVRDELAPAEAIITGSGTGLSGSAWVATVRTDGGYPGAK